MKLVSKRTAVAMTLALVFTISLTMSQVRPGSSRGPGDSERLALGPAAHAFRALGLSDDQHEGIQQVVQERVQGDLGTVIENYTAANRALELAIWSAGSSNAEITDALELLAEQQIVLADARRHLVNEILPILTEEQQAALLQQIEQGAQQREERPSASDRQGRQGPGGGRRGRGGRGGSFGGR